MSFVCTMKEVEGFYIMVNLSKYNKSNIKQNDIVYLKISIYASVIVYKEKSESVKKKKLNLKPKYHKTRQHSNFADFFSGFAH